MVFVRFLSEIEAQKKSRIMKKSFFLVALFCVCSFLSFSQKRGIVVAFSSNHDFYFRSPIAKRNMYGLQFQYFISKNVSLNNRYHFGINRDNKRLMLHYGLGGLLTQASLQSGAIFVSGFFQDFAALILLPIIIPEGVQFHFGNETMKISPYVYPASFEYNVLEESELKAFLELGVQFCFIQKENFVFAPSIAWKMRYGDNRQALSVGFMIGFGSY